MGGVVIVIAANIAYPLHFTGTNLKAEIVAADTLKSARDKIRQGWRYILIIECFAPQDLQGTGVLIDKGKVKPQQIVVDFKSRLFIIANLVDGAIACDDFKVNQRFYLFREVAGLFDIQLIFNFCIPLLPVSNNREDPLGIDFDRIIRQQQLVGIEIDSTHRVENRTDNIFPNCSPRLQRLINKR